MTKDELLQEAKKLGVDLKDSFLTGMTKNLGFIAGGFILGYLTRWIF